ncbi:hypothetical protein CALVIDRAFT_564954 [Calocera viscosa TUFC12733]|uniref:Man1/Src1-like C-terminal domain-containing protein n=1 Tax=Calocera viscosa (strain TUFC12733) TaxID=1330018 RepID=A0A167KZA0_CALVF|nr:hypothetical protein CALVIDRAFT_564954 [Calocera viscosa TUFC12733]
MPPRISTTELLISLLYLESDFDPSTLTVPQLTGLLQAHDVDTRVASNKAGLVALFKSEIAANRASILAKKRKEQAKSPRANGIRDGVTGQLVDGAVEEGTPSSARKAGRRSSVGPASTSTPRRRASRMTATPIELPEEDELVEAEAEPTPEPEPTSPRAKRKSRAPEEAAFSNENIFQAGSSSPDPPGESSVRRRSRAAVTSSSTPRSSSAAHRHAMIAEGGIATDSPNNPFTKAVDSAAGYARRTYNALTSSDPPEVEFEEARVSEDVDLDDEEAEALIPYAPAERRPLLRPATAVPLMVLFLVLIILMQAARSSARLGFCDRGSSTNAVLDARLDQLKAGEDCLNQGKMDCPPIPLFPPSMQALTCTPCPESATCSIHSLTCDAPLIIKRHPLSPLNPILNGFPGLGSVAFPPTCVEDESRKKLLTNAGRWIIERLQRYRGEQVCYGRESRSPIDHSIDGIAAWKWAGVKKSDIRRMMGETREGKSLGEEKLDEVFAGAMLELEDKKYVLSARDEDGEEWVAAMQARMSSACTLRVWAREMWMKSRIYLLALATVVSGLLYVRRRLYLSRQTTALAHSMLPSILSVLQNMGGVPLLSSQLRDSVLSYEPNLKRRKEVWERVEKIVEMNANVRVGEEEVGGDVGRGWRWVGPPAVEDVGEGTPRRRELKY